MGTPAQTLQAFLTSSAGAVDALSVGEFVQRWRLLTGEPPAILLGSRSAMLRLLVESMPVKPLKPAVPTWDDRGFEASHDLVIRPCHFTHELRCVSAPLIAGEIGRAPAS